MTAPTLWYVNGLRTLARAGLGIAAVTGTPKLMFISSAYVLDQDTHDFVDDVSTYEVTGTGVAAGGITLGSPTVTVRGTTNIVDIKGSNVSGISVSACYVVLYVNTGTPSTSPLICITDLSEGTAVNQTVTGITWDTNGIIGFTAAA